MDGSGEYIVHRPEHWVFEGTDLKQGDAFGGLHTIVGYECDGCELRIKDGLPVPTHTGMVLPITSLFSAPPRYAGIQTIPNGKYERWDRGRTRCCNDGDLYPWGNRFHRRYNRLGARTARRRSGCRAHHTKCAKSVIPLNRIRFTSAPDVPRSMASHSSIVFTASSIGLQGAMSFRMQSAKWRVSLKSGPPYSIEVKRFLT